LKSSFSLPLQGEASGRGAVFALPPAEPVNEIGSDFFKYTPPVQKGDKNMACFLAPATAAIITTTVRKKVPPKYHFDWLIKMLWGGVVMLAVEHIANKEIISYPPFLLASLSVILEEILKVGVPMTFAILLVWAVMVFIVRKESEKKVHAVKI